MISRGLHLYSHQRLTCRRKADTFQVRRTEIQPY
jgi:hypothetical protein